MKTGFGILDRKNGSEGTSATAMGFAIAIRRWFSLADVIRGDDAVKQLAQCRLTAEQGFHGRPSAGGDDPLVNSLSVQVQEQALDAGSGSDGTVQSPLPVMHPLAVPDLSEIVRAQADSLFIGVVLHPSQATGDGQKLGVERFVPDEGQVKLAEGCIEGRAMAIHLRIGEGAVDIPEHRLQRSHAEPVTRAQC